MTDEQGKLYYNVNIMHDPTHPDCADHPLKASPATTIVEMKDNLITNPDEYTLSISKFKIDTSGLPLIIPEMTIPQPSNDDGTPMFPNLMQTNYKMTLWYHGYKSSTEKEIVDYTVTANVMIPTRGYNSFDGMGDLNSGNYKKLPTQPIQYDAKGEIKWKPSSTNYINNTDNQCFIYSYGEFIDILNTLLRGMYREMRMKTELGDIITDSKLYIKNDKICLSYTYPLDDDYRIRCLIGFNDKLYHYLGIEYPVSYFDDTYWFGYQPRNLGPTSVIFPYTSYERNITAETVSFDGKEIVVNTVEYTQPINAIMRWGDIKSILITSEQLPIAGEFIPCYQDDGFLVHNNSTAVIQAYKDVYGLDSPVHSGVFEKNAEKIVEVFYPLTSTVGDIRTQIVFTNQDVENGNKIDLIGGSSIRRFDLTIKWMDVHNNIYPLYLPYGCSADIRIVFSHKKVTREQLANGFNAILQAITGKQEQQDQLIEERRKKKQRTNEELVPMYGHNMNNYGYINI